MGNFTVAGSPTDMILQDVRKVENLQRSHMDRGENVHRDTGIRIEPGDLEL